MAIIPPDVGTMMRLPNDSGPQPLTPVRGVPSDLPDLKQGQLFTARIQEVLPESTYRALVAGRSLVLSLPEGASAGDTLELVVVDRSAKVIVARQATSAEGGQSGTGNYPHTTLSPAAQMIGKLLQPDSGTTTAAPLTRGIPVLPAPVTSAPQLASALQQAVSQSGLFYEAHQAEWIAGKRPLNSLLQEPQGQWSKPTENTVTDSAAGSRTVLQEKAADATQMQTKGTATDTRDTAVQTSVANNSARSDIQNIPDDLRPLVHQQLEAAANQRMVWHGELWPGQPMDWEIEEEGHQQSGDTEQEDAWNTTLRLTAPRLGSVEARLRISGANMQLTLSTPYGASAADLQDELPALKDALAAAGITLQTAQVRHESSEPTN